MNNQQPKHRHPPNPPAVATSPSKLSNVIFFGMMALLGGLTGYAGWQIFHPDANPTPAVAASPELAATPPSTPTQASPPAAPSNPQTLRGKWVRTDSDGNYVLDIKSIAADGKLQAAYLNPNPINVAKAESSTVEGQLRVFVELRDVNYPGSTYDLRYDAVSDLLSGEYFQAGQGQRFPVTFERAK